MNKNHAKIGRICLPLKSSDFYCQARTLSILDEKIAQLVCSYTTKQSDLNCTVSSSHDTSWCRGTAIHRDLADTVVWYHDTYRRFAGTAQHYQDSIDVINVEMKIKDVKKRKKRGENEKSL